MWHMYVIPEKDYMETTALMVNTGYQTRIDDLAATKRKSSKRSTGQALDCEMQFLQALLNKIVLTVMF